MITHNTTYSHSQIYNSKHRSHSVSTGIKQRFGKVKEQTVMKNISLTEWKIAAYICSELISHKWENYW